MFCRSFYFKLLNLLHLLSDFWELNYQPCSGSGAVSQSYSWLWCAGQCLGLGRTSFVYIPFLWLNTDIKVIQFSSVAQSCPTLWDPMNRSTPGLPVHHHLLEFTQTHVLWVSDAIQPSHPRSSPSPPALNPSQHQSLFQWVNSSHEVATVLEFQL